MIANTLKPENIYELTPLQQGMLFHTLYGTQSSLYIEQLSFVMDALDIEMLQTAWQHVAQRHAILRTSFHWQKLSKPLQVVHEQTQLPVEEHDWQGLSPQEQSQALQSYLQSDEQHVFNLPEAPLMRLAVMRLSQETYQIVFTWHHILLDRWSMDLLFAEWFYVYECLLRGQTPNLPAVKPYVEYVAWLQRQDPKRAEFFWREQLQGFTTPTPLPVRRISGSTNIHQATQYQTQQLNLSVKFTSALQRLAQEQKVSVNTLVQAAWGLLLSRYSGEEDVVFGIVTSGRAVPLRGVEDMLGLLLATLPLRVQVAPHQTCSSWLQQLHQRQLDLQAYSYSSLPQIQQWSDLDTGRSLFDSLLVFENTPSNASLEDMAQNLHVREIAASQARTGYPLTLVAQTGQNLQFVLSYDQERFDANTIAGLAEHFQRLLQSIVADPQQRLSELPMLSA